MNSYGFSLYALLGKGIDWGNKDLYCLPNNNVVNTCSYENKPDYELYKTADQCTDILFHAQTAYFVSIVIVQWADLIICKTRKLSIFEHGILSNKFLLFGLFFETALAILLCYVPFINIVLNTRPIKFLHWLPALPFAVAIIIYDEIRKLTIRKYPGGCINRWTYW